MKKDRNLLKVFSEESDLAFSAGWCANAWILQKPNYKQNKKHNKTTKNEVQQPTFAKPHRSGSKMKNAQIANGMFRVELLRHILPLRRQARSDSVLTSYECGQAFASRLANQAGLAAFGAQRCGQRQDGRVTKAQTILQQKLRGALHKALYSEPERKTCLRRESEED